MAVAAVALSSDFSSLVAGAAVTEVAGASLVVPGFVVVTVIPGCVDVTVLVLGGA